MKKKLTVAEQIEHMKTKGIKFSIISEPDAALYLENNTYYFKLKSYAKNYAKYQIGEHKGNYINLEFAYLKDLAIIDMLLRHFILKTSTNIEHAVKVAFIRDFNNSKDDGYEYVAKFLEEHENILDTIKRKKENSYTCDLTNKLLEEGFAIWNVIELLSLKEFLLLYKGFYDQYPEALTGHNLFYPMQAVRKLRNAAAHNNCLINSLRKPYTGSINYNSKVDRFISDNKSISKNVRRANKHNQIIYDFVTMLYLVDEITMSQEMKQKIASEAKELFDHRMLKHAEYYRKENSITSAYQFVSKVVDFFYQKTYNTTVI